MAAPRPHRCPVITFPRRRRRQTGGKTQLAAYRLDAGDDPVVEFAILEPRDDGLIDDPLGADVIEPGGQPAAGLQSQCVILDGDYEQHTVIGSTMAHTPTVEQLLGVLLDRLVP